MATGKHVSSALWRLQPGGRLVTITANWFSPHNPHWSEYFQRLTQIGYVAFSAGIEGKAYAKHGTNMETRLTVIERTPRTGFGQIIDDCLSLTDLLAYIQLFVSERMEQSSVLRSQSSGGRKQGKQGELEGVRSRGGKNLTGSYSIAGQNIIPFPTTVPKQESGNSPLLIAHSPLPIAHSPLPVDLNDIVEVKYSLIESHPEESELNEGIYERYQPQTIKIEGAKPHPTPLVQSTAMASIKPPVPNYQPHLPRQVIAGGILSNAQIETIVYAGAAHQEFLSGWYPLNPPEGGRYGLPTPQVPPPLPTPLLQGEGTNCLPFQGRFRGVGGVHSSPHPPTPLKGDIMVSHPPHSPLQGGTIWSLHPPTPLKGDIMVSHPPHSPLQGGTIWSLLSGEI